MKFCRLGDGRTISYREQGQGPVVVMLHGWGMSSSVFLPLMQNLSDSFRILAPDLPGHGHSEPGSGYDLPQLAADMEEWLGIIGITDSYLLGWSLGGMVALELLEHLGGRLKKLILISTSPCFVQRDTWKSGQPATQLKVLGRQFSRDSQAALHDFFARQFAGEDLDDHEILNLRHALLDSSPPPTKAAALGGLDTLGRSDLRRRCWPRVPALVIHGACDAIIPVDAGRYLSRHLPDARWVELEHVGHAPFVTRTGQCAALFKDFLA
ncbi:O-methylpimelyl-(acyl carrier protein) methylesterase [Syntrophotalea carbinolica DSM 2380]|uniref:O-methylpimelyl-(Acyl carrier protein) methylesterase n=1 Tax=Syntrophotalea carbinolica (strain DSM 2380 / NBRC 103641 / GraBd1) TaxID=338963 RepID=Q3A3Z9_SYNC1|nr:alpha/beta fold hydrolase [Syntrophotalea carbinolica]ABA88908.1 O-methylpimelyl-(acyl carrier protein) methylesterase [Syntrophotalea carbinolica DSM 2380]